MEQQAASGCASIPVSEALQQILTTVERLGMLYYHFANTLVAELGEEEGKELIRKAIAAYGAEVGERQRARVAQAGYAVRRENYKTVPDLPGLAWSPAGLPKLGRQGKEVSVCPLAKYWIEKGVADLGCVSCSVEQAKYATFDPACECRHLKNVLDGDDRCVIVVKKKGEWAELDPAT